MTPDAIADIIWVEAGTKAVSESLSNGLFVEIKAQREKITKDDRQIKGYIEVLRALRRQNNAKCPAAIWLITTSDAGPSGPLVQEATNNGIIIFNSVFQIDQRGKDKYIRVGASTSPNKDDVYKKLGLLQNGQLRLIELNPLPEATAGIKMANRK